MKPRLNSTPGLAQIGTSNHRALYSFVVPMNSRLKHAVSLGSFYHSTPSGLNFEGRVEAKITQGVLKSNKILTTK